METGRYAEAVNSEGTVIRLSQRMSDGTVRDFEINPEGIFGSIEVLTAWRPNMGKDSCDVRIAFRAKPAGADEAGQPWTYRYVEGTSISTSEYPACSDPNCVHAASAAAYAGALS